MDCLHASVQCNELFLKSFCFLKLTYCSLQGRSPSVMSTKMPQPEVQTIKLHKNTSGMGLSIVAAKGAGQVSKNLKKKKIF